MNTFRDVVLARRSDTNPAILFEDSVISYADFVQASADRAALLLARRREGPLHVGVLLENVPDFSMWIGAAALVGATIVGINPTRRGAELARDIRHTDCQLIVTEDRFGNLITDDLLESAGLSRDRVLDVDSPEYAKALAEHAGASIPDVDVAPDSTLLLLFTSGTSGAPKAVICTQRKLVWVGQAMLQIAGLTSESVTYQAMPMFHSNGLFTAFSPTLIAGAAAALRRKFSASQFTADVRRYRATYFNYVGKPLSYILATEEQPDDADNTLTLVFGNEGADHDLERFSARFGVRVVDGYGSTETGASISRTDDMPRGALGRAAEGTVVLDAETGEECPPAEFDEKGRLTNAEEAIGEIVNTQGPALFEGYYDNDDANAERMRDGMYWTGDLAYRDAEGFFYFAGRDFEWLRVDGENFSAAPVERLLDRYPPVVVSAVYAVPDAVVGDQVMAAIELKPGAEFDPADFDAFLDAQPDLGTKWTPRYVRVCDTIPISQTSKVLKRQLRAERWECDEPVYFRAKPGEPLRRLGASDVSAIRGEFEARGRGAALV